MALVFKIEHVKDKGSYSYPTNNYYVWIGADDGYEFNDDIKAGYMGTDGYPHSVKLELNGAKTVATGTLTNCSEDATITISGTFAKEPTELQGVTFVIGKNETIVTDNGTTFDTETKKITIRVHIADGYKMTSAQLKASPESGGVTTYTVSGINNNTGDYEKFVNVALKLGTTATFLPEVEVSPVKPQPQEATVTNNIAGTTETHETDDTYLKITVTGNTKGKAYNFFNAKATYQSNDFGEQEETAEIDATTPSDKKAVFNILLSELDVTHPVVLTGSYEKAVTINTRLTNCHTDSPKPFPEQMRLSDTLQVTLKPDIGYKMKLAQYSATVSGIPQRAVAFSTLTDTGATTDITGLAEGTESVTIVGQGEPTETPTTAKYGSINAYKVTLQNLEDFSKKRFFHAVEDSEQGETYEAIDLANFVNRLKRLFIEVGDGLDDTIKCGNYNTDISVKTPEKDVVTVDMGTATIPAHNADLTDYESEIKVFAPFYGFIDVPNDFAGKTISMQYVINVITGGGCVKLATDNIVFAVEQVEPNTDIIYRTLTQTEKVETAGSDNYTDLYLQGLEPYIYCKWYNRATDNPRNKTFVRGKIGSFTGFNTFSDITPISKENMTVNEQETILDTLQRGVYVEASE